MVSESDTGRYASLFTVPRRGVDMRRCASKDAGPQREVDLGVIPHRLEEGKSVSEDVIGGRKECQRGRWAPKGGGLWCPTLVGEENKPPFIRAWKPSRRVVKPWGEAQRGQYLLAVDLGRYNPLQYGYVTYSSLLKSEDYPHRPTRVLIFTHIHLSSK